MRRRAEYTLTKSDIERALSKIIKSDGCWTWAGGHFAAGYGLFCVRMSDGKWRPTTAHRVTYRIFTGPIPDHLELDHLCRNRACCNPAHLEAVSHKENSLRSDAPMAQQARQTHCLNGHEFTEENTYRRPGRPNKRECRICQQQRERDRVRNRSKAA